LTVFSDADIVVFPFYGFEDGLVVDPTCDGLLVWVVPVVGHDVRVDTEFTQGADALQVL